ncbi:MAG: MarR family transcriptional regulator [Xanthobacteraceae bacterium]|nr:MarR family transcriptional regulator [Xanthobacteraceae bacterium]
MTDKPEDLAALPDDLEIIVHGARDGQKLQLRLWLRMLSITKMISQEIRRRLRSEFQATLPQFDVLAQLYRERDGLRLGELSRRTMVTSGNVTGLADRLEADGMIVREELDGDRRVTVAKLTRKGRDAFAVMAKAHEGWLRELMGDVDDHTMALLLDELASVKHSAANRLGESSD